MPDEPRPGKIDSRLAALGLELPEPHLPAPPVAAVVVHGDRARTSGQLPRRAGQLVATGRLGDEVTVDEGSEAARWCVLNALSVLQAALGSLDRIDRVLTVLGFVACASGFRRQPEVLDAASRMLHLIFDEQAVHTRSAVGVTALPHGAPVEIELEVVLREVY